MKDKNFILEEQKLNETLKKIDEAKSFLENSLNKIGKANLDKLKDLRDNPETSGLDFHMYLEQLQQENRSFNIKDKYKRLEELNFLEKEPYFARIDLLEKDEGYENTHPLYIGKFGYTEELPVVTDWRAKVASVYYRYRYPQKNVKYDTPDGIQIRDLLLKRTFEIDDRSLVKYYNNDLQLDESEIIADKIEQRTGGVLEDIIETIQESQLDIIEADPRQVTIVQGCVGSGKSTVAIHKLSHLFFNFPDLVKPERSILVAKNQILTGYLSTLFPKLGIFDVNYKTLRELVINIIFREELGIQVDLDKETQTEEYTLKKIHSLDESIEKVHEYYEKQLGIIFEKEENTSFGGYKYSKNSTPFENITEIITELEEELDMQKDAYLENPKSIKAMFHKDNMKVLRKIVTGLKKLRLEVKNVHLNRLVKKHKISLDGKLSYLETLLYVYLYLELVGFRKFKKYEYCVVDEGQDFSLLEYSILGKVILHGRFCILGDLNQGYTKEGISKWEDISEVIKEAKNAQVFMLDTNYRSTKPIIETANKILSKYTDTYLPKSINRVGPEPVINNFGNKEDLLTHFSNELGEDLKDLNKSIGIIAYSDEIYEGALDVVKNAKLDKDRKIILSPETRITYLPKGLYLSKFENCKGLEFAKVYVLDLNLNNIHSFEEAKKAFVSVTRAMNELSIYSL